MKLIMQSHYKFYIVEKTSVCLYGLNQSFLITDMQIGIYILSVRTVTGVTPVVVKTRFIKLGTRLTFSS